LSYFKEYQGKLAKVAGSQKAASIIKDALYVLSAGSSDFVQNYYVNPWINKVYTPDQYGSYLVGSFNSFVKVLCRTVLVNFAAVRTYVCVCSIGSNLLNNIPNV